MSRKYDVIIIGAGIGGLTSGGLLSKTKKVLVLEKNNIFGGYCSSFDRSGYIFESAIQAINGVNEQSDIYDVFKRAGALNRTKFVSPKHLYRTIFPDYDLTIPQKNINKYKKILSSWFPKEEKNITALFDVMKVLYTEMAGFHKFYKKMSFKKSPFVLKYYKKSLKQLLDEFIADEKLKAIISQYWMYRGLPPSKLSATIFSYICYDYTANGSYYPKGGMRELIANLITSVKKNGGKVLNNKEVVKLHVKKDSIACVELKGGEQFETNVVISNIDVFKTFEMLGMADRHITMPFMEKIKSNILSTSAFKIYLGLAVDLRSLGVEDYEIFLNPGYDIESMYNASLKNDLAMAPLSVTIYSNLTDKFCRKGHSVVSIGMQSGYDFWSNLSGAEYKDKKEEIANVVLRKCERIIPNLRKYIEEKVIATPLTMERYTGNSEGSAYGWNKQNLAEEINFMNPTTPIKNLFLSSQWTKIGGGVSGVVLSSDRVSTLIDSRRTS